LDYSHNGNSATSDVFEFTDGTVASRTVRVTITITPSVSPITVLPGLLPTVSVDTFFSETLSSSGGVEPYTYALQSGALPFGLSLSASGILSGMPTQRGSYSFSVRSTASNSVFVDKGYTGMAQIPTLTLSPTSATAIQGVFFSQQLVITGGIAPYGYVLEIGGPFPAGISISPTGLVSSIAGASQPHENRQPYLAVTFIIALQGVFPARN